VQNSAAARLGFGRRRHDEIAEAVKARVPGDHLDRLWDMRVVAQNDVGAGFHGGARHDLLVVGDQSRHEMNTPVQ
jgi:hypothetical protein